MKKSIERLKQPKSKGGVFGLAVVVVFAVIIGYFFVSAKNTKGGIPSYVTGDKRVAYEWAKSVEGAALLEQIPCYCGCKFEGHKHARHCFWRDDGSFDKHGITCTVCLDIAKKAKALHEQGKNVCEIRQAIDQFYQPNAHLGTDTPLPAGCGLS